MAVIEDTGNNDSNVVDDETSQNVYEREQDVECGDENDEAVDENGSHDEDSIDGDASDEDSSSGDGEGLSGDDDPLQEYTDEHGVSQMLSAYEIQRLERIKRNKAYLSSLGLDNEARKPKKGKQSRERRRHTFDPSELRSSSRRTSQSQVSYAENNFKWSEFGKGSEIKLGIQKSAPVKVERKYKYEKENRMDIGIYKEFQLIISERKQKLKQAQKDVRQAEVELKYFEKKATIHDRKHRRRQETNEIFSQIQKERRYLGGSIKDILCEVDNRMPELIHAINAFDRSFLTHSMLLKHQEQKREHEKKMEMIDAINRFPRALKDARRDLNVLLLERTPKEPPPRRGVRLSQSDAPNDPLRSNQDSITGEVRSVAETKSIVKEWGKFVTSVANEKIKSLPGTVISAELKVDPAEVEQVGVKKRKKGRNVGGWVSPVFSEEIDRSWLASDKFTLNFELSKYVPQIGDTVLYYPSGHRTFLKSHPDLLGKILQSKLRLPLWVRAEREKARIPKKESKKKGNDTNLDAKGNDANAAANADVKEGVKSSCTWWNDEWLEGLNGNLGNYPLVCVVKDTLIEFPPDPNAEHKVVTEDGKGDIQIVWEVPAEGREKNRKKIQPPLCLAVTLRALTPLLPPTMPSGPNRVELSPPPNFTAVTFPSNANVQPFLVPFSWAYKLTHSVKVDDKVKVVIMGNLRGSIENFSNVNDHVGKCRFEDRVADIAAFLSSLKADSQGPQVAFLDKSLPQQQQKSNSLVSFLPLADTYAVIERLTSFMDANSFKLEMLDTPVLSLHEHALSDLIRSTLPVWNSVSVRHEMVKRVYVSPWNLSLSGVAAKIQEKEFYQEVTADLVAENGLTYNIDEPLRAKIECALEDFIKSEDDSVIFRDMVTDDIAPCYSCAVPLGMWFSKILRRLANQKAQWVAHPRCYYRSVESLLSDLSTILENCLLYNSPDSDVVDKVYEIIPNVKRLISSIVSKHMREKESLNKAGNERRKVVDSSVRVETLIGGTSDKGKVAKKRGHAPKLCSLEGPYPERLNRSWIEVTEADGSWVRRDANPGMAKVKNTLRGRNWIPQSGDFVLYSRLLHSNFVKGHHDDLTSDQCSIPQFPEMMSSGQDFTPKTPDEFQDYNKNKLSKQIQSHWLVGKVMWVRAVFPRVPGRDRIDAATFRERSPFLALGITFCFPWGDAKQTRIVYWRPCTLPSYIGNTVTSEKESGNVCESCGCDNYFSFVYPAWHYNPTEGNPESSFLDNPILLSTWNLSYFSRPMGIPKDDIASIDRCLNILKGRCLGKIAPDYVDPNFSVANVKAGWYPTARMGPVLPTFESLLEIDGFDDLDRSISQKKLATDHNWSIQDEEANAVHILADTHFLPPLVVVPAKQNDELTEIPAQRVKVISPKYEEIMCPVPKLCLELIQLRLRSGYYRSRSGIIDDIQEAYVHSSLLVLSKPITKKFGLPFSLRRIANALCASDSEIPTNKRKPMESLPPMAESIIKLQRKGKKSITAPAGQTSAMNVPPLPKSPKKASNGAGVEFNKVLGKLKTNGLSGEEMQLFERIESAKSLYATALVCASETTHVERVFGTSPKQNPATTNAVPSKEFLDKQERFHTARIKLGLLLVAVGKEHSCNRMKGLSTELPQFTIKVSGCNIILDGDVNMAKPFIFEPSDYVNCKDLIKLFFGKPGRSGACARCQARRRSMLACRVQRGHSCPDFNWMEDFRGFGGIDGMLHTLRTGQPYIIPQIFTPPQKIVETEENKKEAVTKDEENGDIEREISKDNTEGDPFDNLEKAQRAVLLSQEILEIATNEASMPPKLSEAFIRSYFLIDPADGKYTTCVVCGLIGDVMCCELHDCPVVVHPKCVGLEEAPENEWFCAKCASIPKLQPEDEDKQGSMAIEAIEKDSDDLVLRRDIESKGATSSLAIKPLYDPAVEEERKTKEFEELTNELHVLLDELKAKRYISKPKGIDGIKVTHDDNAKCIEGNYNKEKKSSSAVITKEVDNAVDNNAAILITKNEDDNGSSVKPVIVRATCSEWNEIAVGSKITKNFGDLGDFTGTIQKLASSENPYYRVCYEDGDEEDLSEDEVQDLLVLSTRGKVRKRDRHGMPLCGRSQRPQGLDSSNESSDDDKDAGQSRPSPATLSNARGRRRQRGKGLAVTAIVRRSPENNLSEKQSTGGILNQVSENMLVTRNGIAAENVGPGSQGPTGTKRKRGRPRKDSSKNIGPSSSCLGKRGSPIDVMKDDEATASGHSPDRKRGRNYS